MTERKLASIRRIDDIAPIEGADMIEVATVGGWKVVVKKGEFVPGDLGIYFEIDSWVPAAIAPFLTKDGRSPRIYNGVLGERLKTVKMRGQISQGLLIRVDPANINRKIVEGDDVTEDLGVQKWEAPLNDASAGGEKRGNFPTHLVPKTNADRVQNMNKLIDKWVAEGGRSFYVTEKLDGTSFTAVSDGKETFVCSRNLALKKGKNVYWDMARKYNILPWLELQAEEGRRFAVQGEIIGPGIQGNLYNRTEPELYVFSIYSVDERRYLDLADVQAIANHEQERQDWKTVAKKAWRKILKLKFLDVPDVIRQKDLKVKWNVVPQIENPDFEPYQYQGRTKFDLWVGVAEGYRNVEELLKTAEGKSELNPKAEREGLVFWSIGNTIKFKAVSNRWLIKNNG